MEKQKIKHYYGIGERQLRRYFSRATGGAGNTGEKLLLDLGATKFGNSKFVGGSTSVDDFDLGMSTVWLAGTNSFEGSVVVSIGRTN